MPARLIQRLPTLGKYAWWIAVVVYICFHASLHIQIAQGRTQPINIDDTYTYIWQGARLDLCRQSCPALDTLGPVFRTPSTDFELHTLRVDKISRFLSVYAPLGEGTVLLVQRVTGMDWGASYLVIIAIAIVLQAVGIGLLLRALWGEWPAAFGLVLVAVTVYKGQGLVYIVPSNITLTIAMIVWAYLIKEGRNAWRILIIGTIVLVLSHPIGRLYALAAIALYITAGHWWLNRKEWSVVIVSLAIVGAYWLFAIISTAPPIDVTLAFFNPEFPTYFDLVRYQLLDAVSKITESVYQFTILQSLPFNAVLLITAFTLLFGPQQRRRAWIFLFLALGLFIPASLTNRPADPGEGNRRIILIFQIVLAGGLGALMVWSLSRMKTLLMKYSQLKETRVIAGVLFTAIVATTSGLTWIVRVLDTISTRQSAVETLINFENYDMQSKDLEKLLSETEATVLYTNQVAMFYGLSSGLHRFKAIYLPALDAPPDLTQVDYILGLQEEPTSDPLEELKALYPDEFIEETFILVEGLESDLRLYMRLP
jgi:hypothetical protein